MDSPSRWRTGRALIAPLLHYFLRLQVSGRKFLNPARAQIIACNHTSHLDPIVVGYACGFETAFLAKAELFRAGFLSRLLQAFHALPVNRGAGDVGALRRASALLRANRTIVLFPEGTRSVSGALQPFQPGVALLAILNDVPVVPAFVSGIRESFLPWLVDGDIARRQRAAGVPTEGAPGLRLPRVSVRFGAPLKPAGFERSKRGYQQFTEQLFAALRQLSRDRE